MYKVFVLALTSVPENNEDVFFVVSDFANFFREDEVSIALKLYNHSKDDSVKPTLKMFESILGTFQHHTFFLSNFYLFISIFNVLD